MNVCYSTPGMKISEATVFKDIDLVLAAWGGMKWGSYFQVEEETVQSHHLFFSPPICDWLIRGPWVVLPLATGGGSEESKPRVGRKDTVLQCREGFSASCVLG